MKRKTLLKRLAIGASAAFLVLFGVLVAHIYIATHGKKNDLRMRQLSRIDFKQAIDSTEADKIRTFVAGLDGVQSTYFNVPSGILVYTYASDRQTSEGVFSKLMHFGNYKAERYVVDAETAKTGCPVIGDRDSFRYKFTAFIAGL